MSPHLVILPVLIPFLAGALLVLLARAGIALQRAVGIAAVLALLVVAVLQLQGSMDGGARVYLLGDWPAPFGIVLVGDRLSAMMVLLTSVIALFSLLHAVQGEDERGPLYHPVFQLQLVGLNGAFLTGDLFNLFVFFEILLIASYCLLVYGATETRLRAGLHYVLLNLVGSALFLIAVGTLYGVTGTLNMAHMAQRVAQLGPADAALVRSAALLLLVVFGLKAAVVPLYFWLPSAYAAASAPVAALFALMTKVGVYSILRVYTLIFGAGAGVAADVAAPWLLPLALATVAFAMIGAVASRELRRMQGYLLIGSVGIMLAALALFTARAIAAGLYYLVHSTVISAGMFLLTDLIAVQRGSRDDLLVPGPPLRQGAILAILFFIGAIAAAGLPPLSGFLGKAMILEASVSAPAMVWVWSSVLGSGLLGLVALSRAGMVLFWETRDDQETDGVAPHRAALLVPTLGIFAVMLGITVFAGPLTQFTAAVADQLLAPEAYIRAVLGGGT